MHARLLREDHHGDLLITLYSGQPVCRRALPVDAAQFDELAQAVAAPPLRRLDDVAFFYKRSGGRAPKAGVRMRELADSTPNWSSMQPAARIRASSFWSTRSTPTAPTIEGRGRRWTSRRRGRSSA